MAQLNEPFLLCHKLQVSNDRITGYRLRQPDPKRCSVKAFKSLELNVIAAGDSFNDVSMLEEADAGVFFRRRTMCVSSFLNTRKQTTTATCNH